MATVSDSVHSPRSSSSINNSSPRVGKTPPPNQPAKWANVVRGESEPVLAAPSSPPPPPSSSSSNLMTTTTPIKEDIQVSSSSSHPNSIDISVVEAAPPDISDSGNTNANASSSSSSSKSKKPAWTKPSNSAAAVEVSPLMGYVSWPALADSAKASPKSSSDSLKTLPDGSASVTQGVVAAASQQKSVQVNANPNSNPSHPFPTRQKSFRRNQGGAGSANGGSPQLSTQPPTTVEVSHNNSPKTASGSSPRDAPHKSHNWEGGQRTGMVSQSNSGNDHQQQQRNSYRRGGGGGHHRGGGDGSNHHNHGNRRDQDRANHESNPSRGFNGRDGHMQQRANQRNFVRPMPPSTAPFISQPPVRPFGNPMGFPDMPSPMYIVPNPAPESLRGVPFFPPHIVFLPPPDPQLPTVVAKQIEYYFSPDNLCKDIYLRKHMDLQGWVPISLIADFNRVKLLTNNIQFILDSVRTSTVVEVQGDKIRKRNDWMNWTLLPRQPASPSDPVPTSATHDVLANHIQSIGLEEGNTANVNGKGHVDAHLQPVLSKSSNEDLNQSNPFSGERQVKVRY